MRYRFVCGCLILLTYAAFVFEFPFHLDFEHGPEEDVAAIIGLEGIPYTICAVIPLTAIGLTLLAGAYSAFVGRRWGLCLLACVLAIATVALTFFWTATLGTIALVFTILSKQEFTDLQKNPLPPARYCGQSEQEPGHASLGRTRT